MTATTPSTITAIAVASAWPVANITSMVKGMDVDFEVIDAQECARRHPLMETHDLLGGLWDPLDGDIDSAQLCQALARHSRAGGAEIYRFNPVEGIYQRPNHEWGSADKERRHHLRESRQCMRLSS
jgi:glycine/D-amino acid oxidase-like deaminating enzyme